MIQTIKNYLQIRRLSREGILNEMSKHIGVNDRVRHMTTQQLGTVYERSVTKTPSGVKIHVISVNMDNGTQVRGVATSQFIKVDGTRKLAVA